MIKDVLLDQAIIAGVGNIYASEALFLAHIHPEKLACDITEHAFERLIASIIEVLTRAYDNSGTTFSNYVDGDGQKGNNVKFLKVFQRENMPCLKCSSTIKRIKQSGRSTFYCDKCQSH